MRKKRLEALIEFISAEDSVLDVGTDHGYLPVLLRAKYPDMRIGASDIADGPLKNCEETFRRNRIDDIALYKSNGLKEISDPYSCTVIAGMGGETIVKILREGASYLEGVSQLILEPNSESEKVRRYLGEHGFRITDEKFVHDYKYYSLIKAVPDPSVNPYDETECEFGPVMMRKKDPVFIEYWTKEANKCKKILESISSDHPDYATIRSRLDKIRRVLL
ncbi:MAG: tRNA (adenine(22)-N(1))-methyltransferase TrmK [Erysipelotrichales bacterium]|nr:tRNA (adenine(22)-N(1))-methyltransferase TrmK [Erysipelotrichales bacterium]